MSVALFHDGVHPGVIEDGIRYRVTGACATAFVGHHEPVTPSGGLQFSEYSLNVELYLTDLAGEWADSAEMANAVFSHLDELGRYAMFLVHDDEELVISNFESSDFSDFSNFQYWSTS
ncbi:hypothetical protein ACIRP5_31285 [Streptomyces sp. NPDC101221]|uniref:hypothetical protein n=1 Tax=Streptomyces sp. NPDC101221 TaxID=3366132 RepID=UPI00380B48D1